MPIEQHEISPSDCPVLRDVETVPTTNVPGCFFANLHRALRGEGIGPPHFRVSAMAGLCAINRIGNEVEFTAPGFSGKRGLCKAPSRYSSNRKAEAEQRCLEAQAHGGSF